MAFCCDICMNGKFVRVLSFIVLAQLCSANATFLKYRIIVGAWFNPGWKRQDPVYFFCWLSSALLTFRFWLAKFHTPNPDYNLII